MNGPGGSLKAGDRSAPDSDLAIKRLNRLTPDMLAHLDEYGHAALGDSALDKWMLPVIAAHGILYVATALKEIVAAAEIISTMEEGELYLEGLYVRPEFQGRGIGTRFLAGICSLLAGDGHKRLLATVDPGNMTARGLYGRAGFKEIDLLPDHYGPGLDRVLLELDLKAGQAISYSDNSKPTIR